MLDQETQPIEPEVMKNEVAISNPVIPVSVDELAALDENHGVAIVEQRHKIVDALRRASVSLTNPQDWLLFKADDRITAYLQDSGCQRIMALWGIEIIPKLGFIETRVGDDPNGPYAITCYADAFCNVTNIGMKDIEGTRYSDEDFVNGRDPLPPIKKKIRVQQAAIANRNGNAVRKLAGLSNVAIEFIEDVWKGTGKAITLCPRGKGFGSKHERAGVGSAINDNPDIKPPICDMCNMPMDHVRAGEKDGRKWEGYYKCKSYVWDNSKRTGNGHSRISENEWVAKMTAASKDQSRDPGQEG